MVAREDVDEAGAGQTEPDHEGADTDGAGHRTRELAGVLEELSAYLPSARADPQQDPNARDLARIADLVIRSIESRNGAISLMLGYLGNEWCRGILLALRTDVLRPSILQKAFSILRPHRPLSQRMMTLNLRAMERDGLVKRKVYESGRAHVEYALTTAGRELSEFILTITEWTEQNMDQILEAQNQFDERE